MSTTGKTIYFITGANRGLGLEFVRQISLDPSNIVIGTVRPSASETDLADLKALQSQSASQIKIIQADVSDLNTISSISSQLQSVLSLDASDQEPQIDYLLNNAGINHAANIDVLSTTPELLTRHFNINVIGLLEVAKTLMPFLKKEAVIMNMSSGVGSCSKKILECPAYAISKAGVNMLTVQMSGNKTLIEKGIKTISMDPGWVLTRMGGPDAILQPETSISGMLKVIQGLKAEDTGRYYQYDGQTVPW